MINEIFTTLFEKITDSLNKLNEIKNSGRESFLADWKLQDSAVRNFEVVIQSSIDISTYLISLKKWKVPATYIEAILILEQNNVISHDLTNSMIDLVKFRNIIVHEYLYIDYEKVYTNFNLLPKIHEFCSKVKSFISQI